MLHKDQSFKCEYSSSNFSFVVSFQYWEIYVADFTTNDTIRIFPAYAFECHSNVIYMPCEWLNVK